MLYQSTNTVNVNGRKIIDITDNVNNVIKGYNVEKGICQIFLQHTSASLVLTENVDSDVLLDIEYFMKKIVIDDDKNYWHKNEGYDDMSAHIRSILVGVSHSIPIKDNKLYLGHWQGLFLYEHRVGNFKRNFVITVIK